MQKNLKNKIAFIREQLLFNTCPVYPASDIENALFAYERKQPDWKIFILTRPFMYVYPDMIINAIVQAERLFNAKETK